MKEVNFMDSLTDVNFAVQDGVVEDQQEGNITKIYIVQTLARAIKTFG